MEIRKLTHEEAAPMELLLLADPSTNIVVDYLKRGECYVLTMEDKVIGVYVLLPTRPETVELVNVAVSPEYQSRGFGKRLVNHAISTAREKGYKMIEIGTGNAGIMQLALYQKCGFRIIGVDFDFFLLHYDEPIYENGIQCRDMIRMAQSL